MTKNLEIIKNKWNEILDMFREIVPMADVTYELWIAPMKPYDFVDDKLVILMNKKEYLSIIRKRYNDSFRIAIMEVTEINTEVLIIDEAGQKRKRRRFEFS